MKLSVNSITRRLRGSGLGRRLAIKNPQEAPSSRMGLAPDDNVSADKPSATMAEKALHSLSHVGPRGPSSMLKLLWRREIPSARSQFSLLRAASVFPRG